VITYLAINLKNKKFQVGSAKDFKRRQKQHLGCKEDYPFYRALSKEPDNFFWLVSEDDGEENRIEEQFYLDFYHGTDWCYNLNPKAECPPSRKGIPHTAKAKRLLSDYNTGKKLSDVTRKKMSDNRKGGGNYNAISIVLTHPDGTEEVFPCIKEACMKYNLQSSNLQRVIHGARKHHKGFSARSVNLEGN
jgi:group I intron endonuclease